MRERLAQIQICILFSLSELYYSFSCHRPDQHEHFQMLFSTLMMMMICSVCHCIVLIFTAIFINKSSAAVRKGLIFTPRSSLILHWQSVICLLKKMGSYREWGGRVGGSIQYVGGHFNFSRLLFVVVTLIGLPRIKNVENNKCFTQTKRNCFFLTN